MPTAGSLIFSIAKEHAILRVLIFGDVNKDFSGGMNDIEEFPNGDFIIKDGQFMKSYKTHDGESRELLRTTNIRGIIPRPLPLPALRSLYIRSPPTPYHHASALCVYCIIQLSARDLYPSVALWHGSLGLSFVVRFGPMYEFHLAFSNKKMVYGVRNLGCGGSRSAPNCMGQLLPTTRCDPHTHYDPICYGVRSFDCDSPKYVHEGYVGHALLSSPLHPRSQHAWYIICMYGCLHVSHRILGIAHNLLRAKGCICFKGLGLLLLQFLATTTTLAGPESMSRANVLAFKSEFQEWQQGCNLIIQFNSNRILDDSCLPFIRRDSLFQREKRNSIPMRSRLPHQNWEKRLWGLEGRKDGSDRALGIQVQAPIVVPKAAAAASARSRLTGHRIRYGRLLSTEYDPATLRVRVCYSTLLSLKAWMLWFPMALITHNERPCTSLDLRALQEYLVVVENGSGAVRGVVSGKHSVFGTAVGGETDDSHGGSPVAKAWPSACYHSTHEHMRKRCDITWCIRSRLQRQPPSILSL
ncbi:hypothetical protein VNO77_43951 [Canavalia gladiata]|uniref:Uncharacterized protein n=1 Tax=Canavalia gladiata TaxID=3824 RepID=A0AAN9JY22_CANGL